MQPCSCHAFAPKEQPQIAGLGQGPEVSLGGMVLGLAAMGGIALALGALESALAGGKRKNPAKKYVGAGAKSRF